MIQKCINKIATLFQKSALKGFTLTLTFQLPRITQYLVTTRKAFCSETYLFSGGSGWRPRGRAPCRTGAGGWLSRWNPMRRKEKITLQGDDIGNRQLADTWPLLTNLQKLYLKEAVLKRGWFCTRCPGKEAIQFSLWKHHPHRNDRGP